MAGMSAVFTGLFGTPLTAMMFCMEFESVGTFFSPALFPCFMSSMTAGYVSRLLGVYPEAVDLTVLYTFTPYNGGRYLLLALGISLLSIFMCWFIHKAEHLSQELLEDPKTRILVGSILLVALTLALGDQRFNGAGMDMALDAVNGQADWYSFLVKLLFTAITLSAGFKGGEIVPTFCIGATFGCVWGGLLGLDPGFSAALGLVGLFCCVTNSPLASHRSQCGDVRRCQCVHLHLCQHCLLRSLRQQQPLFQPGHGLRQDHPAPALPERPGQGSPEARINKCRHREPKPR